jgi:hypothetical protein
LREPVEGPREGKVVKDARPEFWVVPGPGPQPLGDDLCDESPTGQGRGGWTLFRVHPSLPPAGGKGRWEATMLKENELEQIKTRLKEKLNIKSDETLLRLAIWMTIFDDEELPERLSESYVEKRRQEVERESDGIEDVIRKGLIDLAEWYGVLPLRLKIQLKIQRTIKKLRRKLFTPPQRG